DLPDGLACSRQARGEVKKPLVIESVISLGPGSQRLDIETTVVNTVRDHRLRAIFPTYINSGTSSGEAQFDVVDHPVEIKQPPYEIWEEDQPKQFAQKTFASISDGKKGLAIANIGLPEYEITPNRERAIAITLLRAVSHLSSFGKNTRVGAAGPTIETPEAEMIGRRLVFNYSIIPHAAAWHESDVQAQSNAFNSGLKVFPVLYNSGCGATLPPEHSFLSVDGRNIVLSSVRQCEDGQGYAVRVWNGSSTASKAVISLFKKPSLAFMSDIRERKLDPIPVSEKLSVKVGAKSIVTVRLEFD
ncbi:MAG: hypothetical protein M1133_07060, partial [Armatimonadetes bacterium]|nr:hypothetical protein [Armatimonadota bacterium]